MRKNSTISTQELMETVAQGIRDLPLEFRRVLDNVEVSVLDSPGEESDKFYREQGKNTRKDLLLGLYMGIPITRRGSGYLVQNYSISFPDRIFLYERNLRRYCRQDRQRLREQIRLTLLHEIGHYMGLSEEELEELEKQGNTWG